MKTWVVKMKRAKKEELLFKIKLANPKNNSPCIVRKIINITCFVIL